MEENKYYTPDISEFYIGFEFEYFCEEGKLINHPSNIKEWKEDICDWQWLDRICDEYEHSLENIENLTRVKYLDGEDIESFGFKIESENLYMLNYQKDNWTLSHCINDNVIMISLKGVISNSEEISYMPRFIGILKNKSELKRILKQIGV